MKKYLTLIPLLTIISFNTAYATVGGPEYISQIKYFPDTLEIRYTYNAESGLGCPPTVESYSFATKQTDTLLGCQEQIEKLYSEKNFEKTEQELNEIREKLMGGGIELQEIDINQTKVDLIKTPQSINKIEDFYSEYIWEITPRINGEKYNSFPLTLCEEQDKANFTILGAPEQSFIVIIASANSICFEDLYAQDTFAVMHNANIPNANFLTPYIRGSQIRHDITEMPNKIHQEFNWTDPFLNGESETDSIELEDDDSADGLKNDLRPEKPQEKPQANSIEAYLMFGTFALAFIAISYFILKKR